MRSVVIYARFSTDKQDARSLDDQVRRCRRFAEERDLTVVAESQDEAVSGGHVARAGLKSLMADAKAHTFDAVLVDDQSRLARDLGSSIDLIFTKLPALRVALIDCATGRASTEKGARTLFAVNSIVNDAFLEMVKHETHRGMEGRAIGGFATGGRAYGYDTRPEDNAPDPERVRRVYVINETEATVVRRIFRMWIDGASAKAIAHTLNDEGIPAPHDRGKGNKGNRGWVPGTIGGMLKNERYLGRLVWNQREWVKNSTTGKRTPVARPREDWTVTERPDLAIVDRATFQAAQRRKQHDKQAGVPRTRRDTMLSGLLRCGKCRGSLTTVGGTTKNGKRYRTLGCTTHWSRGASICDNGLTVSEKKATASVVAELLDVLSDPETVGEIVKAFEARVAEASSRTEEVGEVETQIRDLEKQVRQLSENLALMPLSEALRGLLAEREGDLGRARVRLASIRGTGRVLPHPSAIRSYVAQLAEALQADDQGRAKTLLQEHVGHLTFTPVGGRYEWSGGLIFGVSVSTTPAGVPAGVVRLDGSGGALLACLTTAIPLRSVI